MNNKFVKPLDEFTADAMYTYGTSVIEERALADFHDGLKPVQRKLLWATYKLGLYNDKPHAKSARITGETMGKYHPHSEAYSVLVNMANAPVPMIDGAGNWGSINEGPAASRYTNARLSKYAMECFFNPRYVNVIDFVPNYDNKEKEPVYLPACLPNILANGSSGIAVAITSNIPSFHLDGLLFVVSKILNGEEVTARMLSSKLKFNLKYGGLVRKDLNEVEKEKASTLWTSNTGNAYFEPEYEFLEKSKELLITGVPPGVNPDNKLEKIKAFPEVDYVSDAFDEKTTTKTKFLVVFRRSTNIDDIYDKFIPKVLAQFKSSENYKLNVNNRIFVPKEKNGGDYSGSKVKFIQTNLLALLKNWCSYRIRLEEKALKYELSVLDRKQFLNETLLTAVNNLDVIKTALEQKDSSLYLQRKLKLSEEQAEIILDMKVRQLSNMNKQSLLSTRKQILEDIKKTKVDLKDPADRALREINLSVKSFYARTK